MVRSEEKKKNILYATVSTKNIRGGKIIKMYRKKVSKYGKE